MAKLESAVKFALEANARVLRDEPLSKHTSFQIGGPADLFITPETRDSFRSIYHFLKNAEIPCAVLGNGSNILAPDEGLRGAVLCTTCLGGCEAAGTGLVCGAGVPLLTVCRAALQHGLTGLEFAYGIPGTVGGAVFMNAGAYGGEIKDVAVRATHLEDGVEKIFSGDALAFGYRHSAYSSGGRVVVEVCFALAPGEPEEIRRKMDTLWERRKQRQPLEYPSAGSIFKRPPGHYAGTLIEQCGLKGARVGGAMVSEKHAGFIINTGGATCTDVLKLIEKIKNEVLRQTGVALECEIKPIV